MTGDSGKVKAAAGHPGEFIRAEVIGEWGLRVDAAAEFLGVSSESLTALLNGQADLTPEMALRLEKTFGVDMRSLLRLQAKYDAEQMRARWDEVEVQVFDWARHLAKAAGGKGETGEEVAPQAGFEPAT